MPVTARNILTLLLLAAVSLACTVATAQSVQPNRYSAQPGMSGTDARDAYRRHRQMMRDARSQCDEAGRRATYDRIAIAIDANRQRMEADRARTDRRRATVGPAESERMRLDFEARRQGYERQREELERQRAATGFGRVSPMPVRPLPEC